MNTLWMTTTRVMMRAVLACALFLAAIGTSLSAPSPGARFDSANRAYGAGKYDEAIKGYEQLVKDNGYSVSVLFNLGNAYYRNGQFGQAILNYERALRLSPRDPDIHANLKLARTQANVSQPAQRWWRAALKWMTPSQWAWLASGLFTVFCLLYVVRLLRAETLRFTGVGEAWTAPVWRLILVVSGLACVWAAGSAALSVRNRHDAVVVAKEATLLASPFDKSESIASLPEGESLAAEKKYGDYVLVHYGRGKSGWVNQSQIGTVEPDWLSAAP
jgi:tetratricopeptide (TPR) repeat protein